MYEFVVRFSIKIWFILVIALLTILLTIMLIIGFLDKNLDDDMIVSQHVLPSEHFLSTQG